MKKFDNDKVTVYRCKRCHKKIWVPESIIRRMGPVCYGKSYAYRRLILKGLTREDILKIPKEKIEQLTKEELKRWKDEHKQIIKPKVRPKVRKIRTRKVKSKKDKNQKTLDLFLFSNKNEKIKELRKELYKITNSLSKTMGSNETDRALELMNKIKTLESGIEK